MKEEEKLTKESVFLGRCITIASEEGDWGTARQRLVTVYLFVLFAVFAMILYYLNTITTQN